MKFVSVKDQWVVDQMAERTICGRVDSRIQLEMKIEIGWVGW